MSHEKREEKSKKRILILLLLLCCGYVGYRFFWPIQPKESVTVISGDFLPEGKSAKKMSDKELADAAQKSVDESNFNMVIGSKAEISEETQKGKLNIKNPQANNFAVNVVITNDATGDVIYTTGAIKPGEEVTDVELEKKLVKGEYTTTASFTLYDLKTKAKKGEVAAGVRLIVN